MRNHEIPLDIPCLVGCPKEGRIKTKSSAWKKVGIIDGMGDTLVSSWQIGYTRAARNSKNSNDDLLLATTTTRLKYGGIALP